MMSLNETQYGTATMTSSMIHQHLHGVEEGLFAARGRNRLLACVRRPEVLRVPRRNRVAQFHNAAHGGVPGEVAMNSVNCCLLDVLRRGEMGLASAKVNQVGTRRAQLLRLVHRCQGG